MRPPISSLRRADDAKTPPRRARLQSPAKPPPPGCRWAKWGSPVASTTSYLKGRVRIFSQRAKLWLGVFVLAGGLLHRDRRRGRPPGMLLEHHCDDLAELS